MKALLARLKPAAPPARSDFSIIVQERADGRLALLVKVQRSGGRTREERSVFTITDRLDPRLEEYLRELSNAARARRLNETRLTRKRVKSAPQVMQMEFL